MYCSYENVPLQVPKMPNVDAFKFEEMKQRIFKQLDSYSGIPFTMQVTQTLS